MCVIIDCCVSKLIELWPSNPTIDLRIYPSNTLQVDMVMKLKIINTFAVYFGGMDSPLASIDRCFKWQNKNHFSNKQKKTHSVSSCFSFIGWTNIFFRLGHHRCLFLFFPLWWCLSISFGLRFVYLLFSEYSKCKYGMKNVLRHPVAFWTESQNIMANFTFQLLSGVWRHSYGAAWNKNKS